MSAFDALDGARSAASKCYRMVASKPERLKEVRPGNDGVRNLRGHDDVMQTRSIRSAHPARSEIGRKLKLHHAVE